MLGSPLSRATHTRGHRAALPAFTDSPVADHPEPVTAEAGIVGAEPDGSDLDAVSHA